MPERPNILLIITDDQPLAETMQVMPKTLRWFADEGTTFTNAYATTPLCGPSRASMLSGRYAHNHSVVRNVGTELDLHYTMQRYLKDAGYLNVIVGKFLNYWALSLQETPPRFDDPPDFDRWTIINGLYTPFRVNDQGTLGWGEEYSTTYLKNKALAFLREERGREDPWFLHLSVIAPHANTPGENPATPEAKYENAPIPPFTPFPAYFEPDRSDKPPWLEPEPTPHDAVQALRAGALRSLMSVDDMVDAVFRELERTGEADNTLAFYTSDHGYLWGHHGQTSKLWPYLESIRVPLFMRWPAGSPAGRVDHRFAANIDLLPTVLEATGASASQEVPVDGRSLLDQAWDRNRILLEAWGSSHPKLPAKTYASTLTRDYHYTEYFKQDDVTKLATWNWPAAEGPGDSPIREYYDLSSDPWELTNLLRDGNPGNDLPVDLLSAQLARDRRCAGHGAPDAEPPPSP